MAFGPPIPAGNAPPAAPVAPPVPTRAKSLAQVSAMGAATLPPGATPTPAPDAGPQAQQPAPAPQLNAGPPAGIAPARPVVAPHASARSVGTHGSRSPTKRVNAPHGMVRKD